MRIQNRTLAVYFVAVGLVLPSLAVAGIYTPLGTQAVTWDILPAWTVCGVACHGDYAAENVEQWPTWSGSMMANSGRDPIFWAALDVANNDAAELGLPGIGEFCIRCHSPSGWVSGRANAPDPPNPGDPLGDADGCALIGPLDDQDNDFDGVSCHFCHRMEVNASPPAGQDPVYFENGNFWLDDDACVNGGQFEPCRKGPYDYATPPEPPHEWEYSDYHVSGDICGNCHNVTNPFLFLRDETGAETDELFPIERTFKEWQQSSFGDNGAAEFTTCPECHMPDAEEDPVYASSASLYNRTGNMPIHQLVGGNTWIPKVLKGEYPGLGRSDEYDATVAWAEDMLQNRSATLNVTVPAEVGPGGTLLADVTVTNISGHKLPTGYGEGRRMWLNVVARDGTGTPFWESGAWDPMTGVLSQDSQIKVYEVQQGVWDFNSTSQCDVVDDVTGNHIFHFVRNNCIVLDNRIPPLGFTGMDDLETRPVAYTYPETSPGSGILVNWDVTGYEIAVPGAAVSPVTVEATLNYQTTSKDYVEFLRDEAVSNGFEQECISGSGALNTTRGEYLYEIWSGQAAADYGKSPPEPMASNEADSVIDASIFADGFESGDLGAWSSSPP